MSSSGASGRTYDACYEVVDAELHAILLALRQTAARSDPAARRCLIVSDCAAALRMTERAWRDGVVWKGRRAGRAGLLHAINEERARLALVVMVWAPAHRGGSVSAYADAAAKAGTTAPVRGKEHLEHVRAHLPHGRCVLTVRGAEGEWGLWPADRHTAYRDAVGWWVLRRMTRGGQAGGTVDEARAGPKWAMRTVSRWDPVWEGTGARAPATQPESGEQGGEREQARGTRRAGATPEDGSADAGRFGTAMAVRAGLLWEAGTHAGKQGCPACCSRARGWHWRGDEWVGRDGRGGACRASAWHVLCGMCDGVDEGVRVEERGALQRGASAVLRALTQQGRGGHAKLGEGRHDAVQCVAAAQRALAKGERASARERDGLRRLLAGALPDVGEGAYADRVARRVVREVLEMQRAAARLRAAWRRAASEELARRAEREGGAEGRRWRGIGMERWRQAMHALAATKGHQEEHGTGADGAAAATASARESARGGWTMAAALIAYKTREAAARRRREAQR